MVLWARELEISSDVLRVKLIVGFRLDFGYSAKPEGLTTICRTPSEDDEAWIRVGENNTHVSFVKGSHLLHLERIQSWSVLCWSSPLAINSLKRLVYHHSTQLGKGELACVTDFSTVTKFLCCWLTLVGFGGPYFCRFPEEGHLHLLFCCSFWSFWVRVAVLTHQLANQLS